MATLNSTQDSDRLIRELMVKNKNLQSKYDAVAAQEEQRAASAGKLQAQLDDAVRQSTKLALDLRSVTDERNAALRSSEEKACKSPSVALVICAHADFVHVQKHASCPHVHRTNLCDCAHMWHTSKCMTTALHLLHLQDAQLEALRGKQAKAREKNGVLKENNAVLSEQLDAVSAELEAQDAHFKRLERQLQLELDRVTQVRAHLDPGTLSLRGDG
jgi:hypothetical protein